MWVQYEIKDCLEAMKSNAVYQALLAFQEASEDIKANIYDKMESKAKEAHRNVPNPAYAQKAMLKAMSGMLELSMATMYKDAMSKAVEANYEKSIQNYYAKSINMAKLLDQTVDQHDHYRKEGLRQNGLVKDLLEQNAQLKRQKEEMERQLNAVEEARLNHQAL